MARAALTRTALEAIALEVLSASGRQTLEERGSVVEPLQAPGLSAALTTRAERLDNELYLELRRQTPEQQPEAPLPPAAPDEILAEPADHLSQDSDFHPIAVAQDADPEKEIPLDEGADAPVPVTFAGEPAAANPYPAVATFAPPSPRPTLAPVPDRGLVASPPPQAPVAAVGPAHDTSTPEIRHSGPSDRPSASGAPSDFGGWLDRAATLGATALYLRPGQAPRGRIDDRIGPLGRELFEEALFDRLMLSFERDTAWRAGADGEWTRDDDRLGQIICQPFTDHAGRGLVVRFGESGGARRPYRQIPRFIRAACDGDGLIVVAAPADDDVAALASTVADWTGRRRGGYVISLAPRGAIRDELHGAFVSQRELGAASDGATAIRRAAAERPDVLLVVQPQGGLAMQAALEAAAGNRLVIVGVVAQTTVSALRILAAAGTPHADAETRGLLAKTFRGGFSHRTFRRLGGGRTVVQDTIVTSADVAGLLTSGDFAGLARAQESGAGGMQSVAQGLAKAVIQRHLTLRQVSAHAADRPQLVAALRAARLAAGGRPSGRRGLVDVSRPAAETTHAYIRAGASAR